MNALDLLRLKLHQSFSGMLHDATWGQPHLMSKVLEEVCSAFDTSADSISKRSIGKTLLSFRTSAKLPTFLDLKYACIGISQPVGDDGWRLLEDKSLFPIVMREVHAQAHNPRRLRKCYQGLLSGYFDYNIFDNNIPEQGRKNWLSLCSFLRNYLCVIQRAVPVLSWVKVISEHANLLGENPCARYGTALAKGDYTELKSVFKGLLIPRNSWIWEVIVLARIRAICSFTDDEFKEQLEPSLAMATNNSGIILSEILKKKCLAQLIRRYAKCGSRPENTPLCDSSVMILGNPWVSRAAWDAHVHDEDARMMIDGWLKRRLITDYFHLLSRDRSADTKRLQYWLRFIPSIEDMWFALGPYALNHPGAVFNEFREIAKDRILSLENSLNDEDNALIMRIDDYVFVEFGSTETSCLVFKSNDLPFDLDKKWIYIGSKSGSGLPHRLRLKHKVRKDAIKTPLVSNPSTRINNLKKGQVL
jgi:hypothetical protein